MNLRDGTKCQTTSLTPRSRDSIQIEARTIVVTLSSGYPGAQLCQRQFTNNGKDKKCLDRIPTVLGLQWRDGRRSTHDDTDVANAPKH